MGAYLTSPITEKVSEDGEGKYFQYGSSSMQGWRILQEDAHNCILNYNDGSFFAVYDGHGGHEVATFCAKYLPDFVKNTNAYKNNSYKLALEEGFLDFDALLTKKEVIEELKLIKEEHSNDDKDSDQEELNDLHSEANMPLEELLAKYQSESNFLQNKLKTDVKKPLSPLIRAKKSDLNTPSCSGIGASNKKQNFLINGMHSDDKHKESLMSENCERIDCLMSNDKTASESMTESHNINTKQNSKEKCFDKDHSENHINGEVNSEICDQEEVSSLTDNNATDIVKGKDSNPMLKCTDVDLQALTDEPNKVTQIHKKNIDDDDISLNRSSLYQQLTLHLEREIKDENDDNDDSTDEDFDVDLSESSSEDNEILDDESDIFDEETGEEEDDDENSLGNDNEIFKNFQLNMKEEPGSDSGCTAVVALFHGTDLYVANAGDSRCVVSRNGKALDMSIDHKPEDAEELKRIIAAGGAVSKEGRVNGGLNLSRAIGDHAYKQNEKFPLKDQMISALPDVRTLTLQSTDEFIILACDGIWNSMTSQQVVDFVNERLKTSSHVLSQICEELFDACLASNTSGDGTGCDNMTAIIVQPLPAVFSGKRSSSCELVSNDCKKRKISNECV